MCALSILCATFIHVCHIHANAPHSSACATSISVCQLNTTLNYRGLYYHEIYISSNVDCFQLHLLNSSLSNALFVLHQINPFLFLYLSHPFLSAASINTFHTPPCLPHPSWSYFNGYLTHDSIQRDTINQSSVTFSTVPRLPISAIWTDDVTPFACHRFKRKHQNRIVTIHLSHRTSGGRCVYVYILWILISFDDHIVDQCGWFVDIRHRVTLRQQRFELTIYSE